MEDYFSYTQKLFDPSQANAKPEALKGIRVLDFSHVIFGPVAARLQQFPAAAGPRQRGSFRWCASGPS